MGKEGKTNIKFIVSVLFFSLVLAFIVFAVTVQVIKPGAGEINVTPQRNINFTFNSTWSGDGEIIANCTLYTNFTGIWTETFSNDSASGNIFNGSEDSGGFNNISNINFTFGRDLGFFVWDVACYNGTGVANTFTFSGTNRSLTIDTLDPIVVQTADIFDLFNTSSATPTITINITDINGTGLNLTANGGNYSINISIFDANHDTNTLVRTFVFNDTNVTCSPSGDGVTQTQCTLDITGLGLSNGTKNLTVSVIDRANHTTTNTSFTFTLDNVPPIVRYFNITNTSVFNASGDDDTGQPFSEVTSTKQGATIFITANFSDNLTQPDTSLFQVLNGTTWVTLNTTKVNISEAGTGANTSFPIPRGHNLFEGANLTFRILVNDTVGNLNATNFTSRILVNDTTVPTVTINGTISVNGTNTSNTRPIISWSIVEGNPMTSINISVDGVVKPGVGTDLDGCNKYAYYDTSQAGANNVEKHRNGSFQISPASTDVTCPLVNGTHSINITVKDSWDNTETFFHIFNIETGTPALVFSSTTNGRSAVNNTNITSSVGLEFNATDGVGVGIANLTYISSCNSSATVKFANGTAIYPFNESSCPTTAENRTLTVTVTDTAGNFNTTVFGFLVDNVGPQITVVSPAAGQNFGEQQAELNISVLDDDQPLSFYGYFLDDNVLTTNTTLNLSVLIGAAGLTTNDTRLINRTGTHTIKFTANDTLGNIGNSTLITFKQQGPIDFLQVNSSSEDYSTLIYGTNLTNVTISLKDSLGNYNVIGVQNSTNNTFEILFNINSSINVSLTELSGSDANWDKINFTPIINDSTILKNIQTNWTNTVLAGVVFNNSLEEFIGNNNSYYGTVTFPFIINLTNRSRSTVQEFWWITDEDTLTTRNNISQCDSAFTAASTTACWNYTGPNNSTTLVFVPHFSVVIAVNDTGGPTITVNTPAPNQTVATFLPNITVTSDAISCTYSINTTDGNKNISMTKTGTSCIGSPTSFNNSQAARGSHNFTFYVNDISGNLATGLFNFNASDLTPPNNGIVTDSPGVTSATITITGTNESVNATIHYGTTNTSLTTVAFQRDFAATQVVTTGTLDASTQYFYNVTVCDAVGNCKVNTTVFTFTTSAADAVDDSTTTTTTAGTGPGGGGGAVPTSNIADSKGQVWSAIPIGSSVSLNIDKATIGITSVSVNNVKSELKNVDITVQALKTKPVTASPAAKVYQYIRINTKNVGDNAAESLKISFRVPKSWLSDNGLDSADITLHRYKSSQWSKLTTTVTGTDDTYVNYEAETPGFSFFAIGSKTGGGDAFAIIDAIREFYAGTSTSTAFDIIDLIRAFYGG